MSETGQVFSVGDCVRVKCGLEAIERERRRQGLPYVGIVPDMVAMEGHTTKILCVVHDDVFRVTDSIFKFGSWLLEPVGPQIDADKLNDMLF